MTRRPGVLLHRVLRRLARATQPHGAPLAASVPEITPFGVRADEASQARLNILLPSINAAHYFGGIHTAVLLYRELCRHIPRSRVILVDSAPESAALSRFADHTVVSCDEDSAASRQIVAFNDRYGRTLPVGSSDVWLATAWWTAFAAQRAAAWQAATFGSQGRVAYLIQDFEPGFYAWSTHSALALSTYRPEQDLAVFNTGLLAEYFARQGLGYKQSWTFEPTLNQGLRGFLANARTNPQPRKRQIIIYGRPSTPRNAFELICEALRHWGWKDPQSQQWEILAPGELTGDVDLGPVRVRGLGKLPIEDYARLLSTSAVGLSLMVSPHPSYPPLEMAAFGMRVVTNRFANKDLSSFSPNIISVDAFAPEAIAQGLSAACSDFESAGMMARAVMEEGHAFLRPDHFGELAAELAGAFWEKDVYQLA